MSLLDVSDVLSDPDFADAFAVKRRAQVMGQNGRAGVDVVNLQGVGVIYPTTANELKRLPDEQHTERHISIVTDFRLRATAPDYQPDLVGWQGDFYIVADVQPYTQYGAGFVHVICASIDYQDEPPGSEAAAGVLGPATPDEGGTQ